MSNAAPLFDLSSIEEVESADFAVKDPTTGRPTGMVIRLAGPEHPARKARDLARLRRLRKVMVRTGKLPDTDPEEDEADELDNLVACTLGWEGATVPYSTAEARRIYADPRRRWLRRQVATALNEAELFTRASAQS